ncbi:unnamed protein product, partial [Symbiodinium sp. KB8]
DQVDEPWDADAELPPAAEAEDPEDDDDEGEPTNRQDFQKWRAKFRNNVELAAELYQDRSLQQSLRMIYVTTRPAAQEYYDAIQIHKQGQASQLKWTAARCSGSWYKTVLRTLVMIHDAAALADMGLSAWHSAAPASGEESWVQEETAFLETAWKVLVEISSARCWSQAMYSTCMPFAMSAVFGPSNTHGPAMEFIRNLDAGLAEAHRLLAREPGSATGVAVTALLKDLWWHTTQLALEGIQTCRDARFSASCSELRSFVFCCFAGPSNTKFTCEDVFAHMAHVTQRSQKGAQVMSKWCRYFYASTCTSALNNGYKHIGCESSDYHTIQMEKSERYGLYFSATRPPDQRLELGSLEQVKQKWGTAGTLADMRMCAATVTVQRCAEQGSFEAVADYWTGTFRDRDRFKTLDLLPSDVISSHVLSLPHAGVFFSKGLVILNSAEDTAYLSLGFRGWAAQAVPLQIVGRTQGGELMFVVSAEIVQGRMQPHWLWNSTATATGTRWKACQVNIMHPACLPAQHRRHVCALRQCSPVEGLVKACLRASCVLTQDVIVKLCKANKAPKAVPTGKLNKKGKRSTRKGDHVRALLSVVFPEMDSESDEYTRILEGLVGGTSPTVAEDCSEEILSGIKALDPDNQEKFAGLRSMAEKVEVEKQVRKRVRKARAGEGRSSGQDSKDPASSSGAQPRAEREDASDAQRGSGWNF